MGVRPKRPRTPCPLQCALRWLDHERNTRTGFFEREQFEAVRRYLPEEIRPLVTFAYCTGWRVPSEVQPLEWRQVDWQAGTVHLEVGATKNDDGRTRTPLSC